MTERSSSLCAEQNCPGTRLLFSSERTQRDSPATLFCQGAPRHNMTPQCAAPSILRRRSSFFRWMKPFIPRFWHSIRSSARVGSLCDCFFVSLPPSPSCSARRRGNSRVKHSTALRASHLGFFSFSLSARLVFCTTKRRLQQDNYCSRPSRRKSVLLTLQRTNKFALP